MSQLKSYLILSFALLILPLSAHPHNGNNNGVTEEQELTVVLVLRGGRVLKLSDGSSWQIAPQDINTASVWLFSPPIEVKKNKDAKTNYPYTITNKTTGSSVLAQRIPPSSP